MASKVIAQIILQGTAVLSRAFFAAYQQALQNAKAGGGAANLAKVVRGKMQEDEALKILNIDGRKNLTPDMLLQKYSKLFDANDPKKGGSFYLQSKIYRAKEALDLELKEEIMKNAKKPNSSDKKDS
mmetsp:Transcript_35859/g.33963  ORF Transcript_35859/g.33963 Transcript_35859/m.33963 type:complete len:127 (-) Transcript_35859:33-413(-)